MLFKKVPMKRYGLFPFLNLNGLVAHYIEYLVGGLKGDIERLLLRARFKEAEGGAPLLPQQTHVFKRR